MCCDKIIRTSGVWSPEAFEISDWRFARPETDIVKCYMRAFTVQLPLHISYWERIWSEESTISKCKKIGAPPAREMSSSSERSARKESIHRSQSLRSTALHPNQMILYSFDAIRFFASSPIPDCTICNSARSLYPHVRRPNANHPACYCLPVQHDKFGIWYVINSDCRRRTPY